MTIYVCYSYKECREALAAAGVKYVHHEHFCAATSDPWTANKVSTLLPTAENTVLVGRWMEGLPEVLDRLRMRAMRSRLDLFTDFPTLAGA